ncbi:MAG: hypothetical protein ACTS22_03960 [Phycisphaerales bacterium]
MKMRTALTVMAAGAAMSAQGQLLNANFETPGASTTFANWDQYGNPANLQVSTELVNGFGAVKMFGDFFIPFNTKGVFQTLTGVVNPGDEWEAAIQVGQVSSDILQAGNRGFCAIVYRDASGTNLVDAAVDILPGAVSTDAFGRVFISGVAPLGAVDVQINVGFQQEIITAAGALHFDDAELFLSSSGNEIPFYNGGFEEIVFGRAVEGWFDFGNSIPNIFTAEDFTSPPAAEGAQSVLMFGQFNGDPMGNDSGIFQALPASAGESWTASAQVYNDPGDPIGTGNVAVLSLVFRDAGGNVLSDNPVTAADSTTPVGVWAPVSSTATAPANTATAEIVLVYSQAGPSADLNGDGSIGAGDEPAGLVRWDDASLEQGGTARLCADVNQNGLVEPGDFTAWVAAFNAGDLLADSNQNQAVEPGDFTAWVNAYNLGAAGPTCTP